MVVIVMAIRVLPLGLLMLVMVVVTVGAVIGMQRRWAQRVTLGRTYERVEPPDAHNDLGGAEAATAAILATTAQRQRLWNCGRCRVVKGGICFFLR